MWVRVSNAVLEQRAAQAAAKASRGDWLWRFGVGVAFAALLFEARYCGYRAGREGGPSTYYEGSTAVAAMQYAPYAFVVGFALAWGVQHQTRKLPAVRQGPTLMCDRCFKAVDNDGRVTCECGGNMDDLQNWEWVETPSS